MKSWKLSPYQKAELWGKAESLSLSLYQDGACKQNLAVFNINVLELASIVKKLQRAQVADAIEAIENKLVEA